MTKPDYLFSVPTCQGCKNLRFGSRRCVKLPDQNLSEVKDTTDFIHLITPANCPGRDEIKKEGDNT